MMTFRLDESMYFVVLSRYGDHYEWNKVVTCIHNVLSQQRYLEHYGEVTIRNLKSNTCTCKITFVKVTETTSCSTWSFSLWMLLCSSVLILIFWIVFCCSLVIGAQIPTRTRCRARCWTRAGVSSTGSEVCGMKASSATLCPLRNVSGSQVSPRSSPHDLFTALFLLEFKGDPPVAKAANQHKSKRHVCAAAHLRDLCHPADPQPKDDVLYYGFSTFAMELNELPPELKPLLPPTDSRLRPDQRWGIQLQAPVSFAVCSVPGRFSGSSWCSEISFYSNQSVFSCVKVSLLNCSLSL